VMRGRRRGRNSTALRGWRKKRWMMRRRLGGVELIMVAARRKERVDECAASGRSLKGGDGTVSARLVMATSERLSRALGGLVGGTLSSRYWSVARRRAKREALRSSREDESCISECPGNPPESLPSVCYLHSDATIYRFETTSLATRLLHTALPQSSK
jgi:ribosomal protein L34E